MTEMTPESMEKHLWAQRDEISIQKQRLEEAALMARELFGILCAVLIAICIISAYRGPMGFFISHEPVPFVGFSIISIPILIIAALIGGDSLNSGPGYVSAFPSRSRFWLSIKMSLVATIWAVSCEWILEDVVGLMPYG